MVNREVGPGAERVAGSVVAATQPELVARARHLARPGCRRLLGITGPPGAGKSTLAQVITEALGGAAVAVAMDGFHLANEVLEALGRRERKGAPDTFDVAGYLALLHRLRSGESLVYAPRFDRDLEQSIGSAIPVPGEVPLVVTEGNYLLHDDPEWRQVAPLLDEVWYLEVSPAEVTRRLVARRVGHGHPAPAARDWVDGVDLPNARLIASGRERTDLVVRVNG